MRAIQITSLDGPDAVTLADLPDAASDSQVVIEVKAAGVAFPELLQTRGLYQMKPDLPFVPGAEVSGVVESAPEGSGLSAGDRVAALPLLGGFAEKVQASPDLTFALPDEVSFEVGPPSSSTTPPPTSRCSSGAAWPRARPCSCTAPPAASAPPRSRWPRPSVPAG